MKFIHTSDWHLGQVFYGKSRQDEHRQFLRWLLQQVQENDVDFVLIAGDIFDTGSPPSYARSLFNDFIAELYAIRCPLVVVAGNHDSTVMLNESASIWRKLGVHILTQPVDPVHSAVVTMVNKAEQAIAKVCAIPFLRARDITTSQAGQSELDKRQQLSQAIIDYYHQIHAAAQQDNAAELPVIITGHMTLLGGQSTESVRDIYIGTLEALSVADLPSCDYLAMGHLHQQQQVGGLSHCQYSGSPLELSFDECGQTKSVNLVSFAQQDCQVEQIAIPQFQQLQVLRGNLAEIEAQLTALVTNLASDKSCWLSIEVNDGGLHTDIQNRLLAIIQSAPIAILQIKRLRPVNANTDTQQMLTTLTELTPEQVFERRLAIETSLSDDEIAAMQHLYTDINARLQTDEEDLP